jgi:hypothetical protein
MGWPSRSGPAGRPISAPLRSQAAPRPGGTCSRPAARFHLPPGATARVASSLIKLVSAAPGGTCPRPAARLLLPPGATARVASSLIEPVPAAPGGTCPPARGPLLPATEHYGPRGASALQAGPAAPGGTCSPDRGPPLPATEHYGSRGAFTLQSWCSHRLGERLPPARGLHLLATGHYGPCGIFTHQAGRSAPPTAARPRSSSLVVVTRRSRLATSRDHLRERPLPVTPSLSSRWTSRREEEGRGDVISPFPTRVAGRWSWPLSPSPLLNNPSGLKQVSVE